MRESIDTVVIGGGQAGLCVGYHLKQRGVPFVILDAHERVGDAWRLRWDSLLLFTPSRFVGLPGQRYPGRRDQFIGKDAMADYLESYAANQQLAVRTGARVERLSRVGDRFEVATADTTYDAANVVVAMANSQVPRVPVFAGDLNPSIVQLHSKDYRNLSQLQPGNVLVVGAGNSGADIAMEVGTAHPTWMAGKESAAVPFRIEPWFARNVLVSMVRFVGHHVLSVRTPIGRKARPKMLASAAPLVRVKPKDLVSSGVQRVSRIVGVRDGLPVTADGETLDVANVIWCTGFRPGFSWIDLPILGDRQEPRHVRGVVAEQPGLYFVGLHFLYSATSETVTGVDRDARRVVRHLSSQRAKGKARRAELVAAG